jgi:hypothetical protein
MHEAYRYGMQGGEMRLMGKEGWQEHRDKCIQTMQLNFFRDRVREKERKPMEIF